MKITSDIEDLELESFVNHTVINMFNDVLSQQPPANPLALMLQAHIRDFGKFSTDVSHKFEQVDGRLAHIDVRLDRVDVRLDHIDVRLDRIDGRLDHIDVRLDHIENTMATKKDLERFATKEDLNAHALQNREDLNAQTVKIIDAVRKLLGQ